MGKGAYVGLQIAGMVVTIMSAQAAIRLMVDHSERVLWGVFDWTLGNWGGRLVALVVVVFAAMLLASWSHDKAGEFDKAGKTE